MRAFFLPRATDCPVWLYGLRAASWLPLGLLFLVFASWDAGVTSLFVASIIPLHALGVRCLEQAGGADRQFTALWLRASFVLPLLAALSGNGV